MSDPLVRALIIEFVLSILLVTIEVHSQSKVTRLRACLSGSFFVYAMILIVGNSFATLIGSITVSEKLPGPLKQWSPFLYAFFGVFAFQGIIGNTNITIFGKGVLTIDAWIAKARDAAVAKAVARGVQLARDQMMKAANRLQNLTDDVLNAYVEQHLGAGTVTKLDEAATKGGSNAKLYKALELANKKPDETDSIIKANGL